MTEFTEHDEGPHAVPDNPLFQESVLLHWYDQRQGIGGWHRIGHEPNNQGGKAALWSYLFDRSGWQYRRCTEVAITDDDRMANGFGAGPRLRFVYEGGAAVWTIRDGELDATLACRNLYPLVHPFPAGDDLAAKRFPHHFEVAGPVKGRVTYRGRSVDIDGFGYRDHSWGARDWEQGMLNHRWFTGTLGADLSFAAITAHSAATGKLSRVGYIARGGKVILARDVDVVAYMEPDGLTHRGGEIALTLSDGEVVQIRFQARAGVLFQRGSVVMVEMMCDAQGHGLTGYVDAEISSNPRNGKGLPLLAINATMADGFSQFAPLEFTPPPAPAPAR